MKKTRQLFIRLMVMCSLAAMSGLGATAQFNLQRAVKGLTSAAQALTLSDKQMADYVGQYVAHLDKENKIAPAGSQYTKRLNALTAGLTEVEGIPLNFKVYETDEVNAFACADGSVRVFTGLMDIMSDDELLGVIGHEMGHVALHHSKNAFKSALLRDAVREGIASTGTTVAALTDSQLSKIGDALLNARYSQKQEKEADDYGYEFLQAAGKNPGAMALSFRKLKSLQGDASAGNNKLNQLFSTHPDIEKRIKKMEKRARKDGITLPD